MSYNQKGFVCSIEAPVKSISVNKLNIAVTDNAGFRLFEFDNHHDSKNFLAFLYQL
ncbi:hypothetical protein tinsulaeT_16320 [Thalassotalea insulae]|uniref:Transposase n=1 Tax=Thalassotalea insulae TaxID=2056778 RepID=A0ABQ6GSC3_9GAMM|nr:hypothetical protein [Thalassotalea insulae]GLX78292.1 hypothetical protein tinsulaeT_16320 [Thalassotalea insulae]